MRAALNSMLLPFLLPAESPEWLYRFPDRRQTRLPDKVIAGEEPFQVIGAIAGG